MRYLKILGLAITALMAFAGSASATTLTGAGGATLGIGTTIAAEAEGTLTLHPPIGDINIGASKIGMKTTNGGGTGVSVTANVETLTFANSNAEVLVLRKGVMSIEGTGSNSGTLTSSAMEWTVEFSGFHCIFSTSNTPLGTVTGSSTTGATATLDISATIPRTGGRSGAFCGSTAAWTGAYKFTEPDVLNIDK